MLYKAMTEEALDNAVLNALKQRSAARMDDDAIAELKALKTIAEIAEEIVDRRCVERETAKEDARTKRLVQNNRPFPYAHHSDDLLIP